MIIWQITDDRQDSEHEVCLYRYIYRPFSKAYHNEPSSFMAEGDGQQWRHYNQRNKAAFITSLGGKG